ncbi:LuxR C-terminal-related transcriptional regulator [Micromonospora echinofusca]|uniref:LuxR C-terminal-related transcriptional regulator n=1 Tax=Micromonospora echinofusca TaxID=47858 RepID=UPI00343BC8F5
MTWPATESPLIGREKELAAAVAALRVAGSPGTLLAGPTGVGKTRLAHEAADRIRGVRVLPVRWPVAGSGLTLAGLTGLLPSVDSRPGGPDPVQLGLLGLRRLAEQGRTILFVDDAHRLDETSLAVLHQAVIEGLVTLLATARTDEPGRDALTALWKDAGVVRIDLAALGPQASDALLVAALDGPVEGRTLRRLCDAAAGNPLFLRELVASALESGLLECPGGLWQLTGPMTAVPRLAELLRGRLADTGTGEREALELLAAGEPVPLPVASAITGEEVLEALERRGLIAVDLGDQPVVRLRHPLYGELLRADTPALGRRRHVRRLADALGAGGPPGPGNLIQSALWRLDGGGPVNPEFMLAAAERAALTREYALAQRFAHRAWSAGGGILAGLASVRALAHLGRADEAVALCVELSEQAAVDGTEEDRCQVAIQHADILVHAADDVQAARTMLELAAGRAGAGAGQPRSDGPVAPGPPGPWRDGIDAYGLYLRSYQLDCTVIDTALATLRRAGPVPFRLAAGSAAGCALLLAGRIAEAEALILETLPLARRHVGASQMQSSGISPFLALVRCYRPDPGSALELARAGYETSLHPPDPVCQALHALVLAQVSLVRGQPRTALRWAQESRLVAGDVGLRPVCRWASAVRVQACVQLGWAVDDALTDLDRYASGPASVRLFDMEVARARAWHGAAQGDGGAGVAVLADAVAEHARLGAVGAATVGALDLVRLGAAGPAARLLDRHPPEPGWALGAAVVRYATAAVAGDAEGLLDVADRFGRYDMPLHAAEAASLAGSRWLAGDEPGGVPRAQLVIDIHLARLAEPVNSPALRRRTAVGRLTAREQQIVLAAAAGERTRSIAQRLHLSERTVENHLNRAYRKLGVAGRAELRGALSAGGLDPN